MKFVKCKNIFEINTKIRKLRKKKPGKLKKKQ